MADYNDTTRLKILKGLSEIEGTEEVVKQLQDNLVALWKIEKPFAKNLFAKLELDKAGSEVYFDMWVKYVVQKCDKLHVSKSVINKLSRRHGDEGLLKMFNALAQAEVGKNIQGKLTSALITSWKNQEKSTRDVYELLELNVKSEFNEPINVKLFSMWVQYAVHMQDTDIGAVINRCNLDFRVAILGDLKQIKGMNGVVQLLQNSLLGHFLNFEGSYQDQVVQVFRDLNLQNDLLRNPNLDLFYSFTEKLDRGKTKEEWLITAARAACGDMVLNKILEAAKKNDQTAKLLRRELDKQKILQNDNAFNAYLEGQLQLIQE
ncbi:hypothetical protein KXD40_006056 [Peronospora effusa]|uniref:RxLR effector protein n=1 Tax=Peronospora effusa TaxID=542832 RepID=A0A3M6VAS5_9STRA|nr:hypothetical protein DD238_005706 [Peronospora effusa]RQM17410.1 hypothetical protein DD237_001405 [Peronospora effusa]UIZ25696.1 hypothetical protein KXD40_006056 [Peronospora effusa]CAI5706908.1 unnamed protein product [Peronospora effusa]